MNRTITVRGTGSLTLKPDLTSVTLTVRAKNMNYDAAMEKASALLLALRDALMQAGFPQDDLKTVSFNVHADYEGRQDAKGIYRNVFTGYSCVHGLKLEFDFDTERLSHVLGIIAGCIAEPELNVRFTVKNRADVNEALLRNAVKNAEEQARTLCASSGVGLGQLISVDCVSAPSEMYSPTDYAMDARCMAKGCAVNMDMVPDDINVQSSAVFVWEIIDR